MNIEKFKVFWDEYNAALMTRDVDEVLRCYDDDIIYDESPMMMPEPRKGKKECGSYWEKVFAAFSSIDITTESLVFENNHAWVEWTMNNFHTATKKHVEIHGALVVTMSGGRISHEKLYWDSAKLFRDLGAWDKLSKTGIAINVIAKKIGL